MNTTQTQGTAELGQAMLLTTLLLQGATISGGTIEVIQARTPMRAFGMPEARKTSTKSSAGNTGAESVVGSFVHDLPITSLSAARPTTQLEKLVGELRSWRLFPENWDGEGAMKPSVSSLKEAELFARLCHSLNGIPEAMLNANGRAGLSWSQPDLYADLEFLGDGRLAYYIESNGDRNKGVVAFNSEEVPAVLKVLLGSAIVTASAA